MRVLVADKFEREGLDGLADLGCEVLYQPELQGQALAEAVGEMAPAVLIVRSTKVQGPVFEAAGKADQGLRMVIRAGAGVDSIDLAAAEQAGVAVCNCPGMNAAAVAELAMGLLLCCDRRLPDQTIEARGGRWNKQEFGKAKGLKELRLGVIGLGSIGLEVVQRASAFGMEVIGWSRSLTPERAEKLGVEYGGSSFEELPALAARCDAVSIHLASTPETRGVIDRAFFEALPEGAYFVNTARGSIVDEASLRWAVGVKKIRCGLDVFEQQPAEPVGAWENDSVRLPGVYATHHIGASTTQAQRAVAEEAVRLVAVFRETGEFENRVRPVGG